MTTVRASILPTSARATIQTSARLKGKSRPLTATQLYNKLYYDTFGLEKDMFRVSIEPVPDENNGLTVAASVKAASSLTLKTFVVEVFRRLIKDGRPEALQLNPVFHTVSDEKSPDYGQSVATLAAANKTQILFLLLEQLRGLPVYYPHQEMMGNFVNTPITTGTFKGQTPLMRAAAVGQASNIKSLLKHGANIAATVPDTGWTALDFVLAAYLAATNPIQKKQYHHAMAHLFVGITPTKQLIEDTLRKHPNLDPVQQTTLTTLIQHAIDVDTIFSSRPISKVQNGSSNAYTYSRLTESASSQSPRSMQPKKMAAATPPPTTLPAGSSDRVASLSLLAAAVHYSKKDVADDDSLLPLKTAKNMPR